MAELEAIAGESCLQYPFDRLCANLPGHDEDEDEGN